MRCHSDHSLPLVSKPYARYCDRGTDFFCDPVQETAVRYPLLRAERIRSVRVILLAQAVLLPGCVTIPKAYHHAWEHERQTDTYIHRYSRVKFPIQFAQNVGGIARLLTVFGGMRRTAIEHYDDTGRVVSVRYEIPPNLFGFGGQELTVFVYPIPLTPPSGSFEEYFRKTVDSIVQSGPYPKMRFISQGFINLERNGTT